MDRQVVFPRERGKYSEWFMERRVWIACALGALCFALGYLIASPRLHAAGRASTYAPPAITVRNPPSPPDPSAPAIRISETSRPEVDPDANSPSADRDDPNGEKPQRPRRKRRVRRQPAPAPKAEQSSETRELESKEPVVIYAPPGESRDMEEGLRRELEEEPPQ